jgi:hypothetical protein
MGSLAGQLEQSGVAIWIRESGVLYGYPLILFLHTLGLSTLVGLSSAINLRLLGFARGMPLAALGRLFTLMWTGLALTAATGLMLFVADATRHSSNPAFSIKLLFVAGAVTALALIWTRVFRLPAEALAQAGVVNGGRVLAAVSLACWFGALSAGRLMAYVAEFVL